MKESRDFLTKIGMPSGDAFNLPDSQKRFPDGAQYRFEVPGIQNPGAMRALLEESKNQNIILHRITQTKGIMQLSDDEIREMVSLSKDYEVQLLLAIGPRATTDTSASARTTTGMIMGNRLRGQEQIVRAMEDLRRGVRLGGRFFLLYDEGCLWIFNKMRAMGEVPEDCHFKVSANCGYGNPCSIKMLEESGANSVNPVWDLSLPMLSAIRQAVQIPIDVHIENPKSSGGFIRHYEVPEMIRLASPIYLKMGGEVEENFIWHTAERDARQHLKRVSLVNRVIQEYYPEATISPSGSIL